MLAVVLSVCLVAFGVVVVVVGTDAVVSALAGRFLDMMLTELLSWIFCTTSAGFCCDGMEVALMLLSLLILWLEICIGDTFGDATNIAGDWLFTACWPSEDGVVNEACPTEFTVDVTVMPRWARISTTSSGFFAEVVVFLAGLCGDTALSCENRIDPDWDIVANGGVVEDSIVCFTRCECDCSDVVVVAATSEPCVMLEMRMGCASVFNVASELRLFADSD